MTTSNTSNFRDVTCAEFADMLADFLERDTGESSRAAMEAHALACAECGVLLADLRKLRLNAANLPQLVPSRDLWTGVAARIETPVVAIGTQDSAGARVSGHATQWKRRAWVGLAAAGLVAVTATITHEITKRSLIAPPLVAVAPVVVKPESAATLSSPSPMPADAGTGRVPGAGTGEPGMPSAHAPTRPRAHALTRSLALASNSKPSVEQTYDSEIRRLRTIVNQRRGDLDSATVVVIDKNLRIIDDAIAQCRLALRKDPNSRFLTESLNDALDSKVQLLRTAAALPARM
jgi:hypothetical protein